MQGEVREMQQPWGDTTGIVIPTGRNGFCCVVPCALIASLYSGIGVGASLLVWRALRRRYAHDPSGAMTGRARQ